MHALAHVTRATSRLLSFILAAADVWWLVESNTIRAAPQAWPSLVRDQGESRGHPASRMHCLRLQRVLRGSISGGTAVDSPFALSHELVEQHQDD